MDVTLHSGKSTSQLRNLCGTLYFAVSVPQCTKSAQMSSFAGPGGHNLQGLDGAGAGGKAPRLPKPVMSRAERLRVK